MIVNKTKIFYTDLKDEGTVFNSDKIFKSNVSALNGAFFKVPGWLNIHPGFIKVGDSLCYPVSRLIAFDYPGQEQLRKNLYIDQ